jgi:hypothetical protein
VKCRALYGKALFAEYVVITVARHGWQGRSPAELNHPDDGSDESN